MQTWFPKSSHFHDYQAADYPSRAGCQAMFRVLGSFGGVGFGLPEQVFLNPLNPTWTPKVGKSIAQNSAK